MKLLSFALALGAASQGCKNCEDNALLQTHKPQEMTFESYLKKFGKSYSDKELPKRKMAFEAAKKLVDEHNSKGLSWTETINEFSDFFPEELKALRGYRKDGSKAQAMTHEDQAADGPSQLPESWDWREQGDYVTPAKNQGHCGSCWAFAATAVVESFAAIASQGLLTVLGTQTMVSCAQNPRHCGGTGGCDGATAQIGFELVKNMSLTYPEAVPYTSFWGETGECSAQMKYHAAMYPVVTVSGHHNNPSNKYTELLEALVQHGPQAISVDASGWSPYEGGIADYCPTDRNVDIDHAVVLMGYGTENGLKYWLVRNSWGTLWGEDGYIRLLRHDNEGSHCGTDHTPLHGSLCADENVTEQTVCGTCGILFDTSYPLGVRYVGMGSGDVNR